MIPWTTISIPYAVERWAWFQFLQTADTTKIEASCQNGVDQSPEGKQKP